VDETINDDSHTQSHKFVLDCKCKKIDRQCSLSYKYVTKGLKIHMLRYRQNTNLMSKLSFD
jgi:hypothetical protein